MRTIHYVGQELDIFAHATHWKGYWSSQIGAYVRGDVLEVGAGLGANTSVLNPSQARSWTALEPDPDLAERLKIAFDGVPGCCKVMVGTTNDFEPAPQFDTILYIDVLEHIESDHEEMVRAAGLLRIGGNIIVLSPAHQWLYTPFDRSIGHFRRYSRRTLKACGPSDCELIKLIYLDSVGMSASLGNRLFLQQSTPGLSQITFWDRFLVPVSMILDPVLFYSLGKSVLGIWRKP